MGVGFIGIFFSRFSFLFFFPFQLFYFFPVSVFKISFLFSPLRPGLAAVVQIKMFFFVSARCKPNKRNPTAREVTKSTSMDMQTESASATQEPPSPKKMCTEESRTTFLRTDEEIGNAAAIRVMSLHGSSSAEMPGCLEISNPSYLSLVKEHGISLIILADVSGSMLNGQRIINLRKGIIRLGELVRRFSDVSTDFTLISFNHRAEIRQGPGPIPSPEKLQAICDELRPAGDTDIGKAIRCALEVAESRTSLGRAVQVVLFTDGEDQYCLESRIEKPLKSDEFISTLATNPLTTFHSVAICSEADSGLLNLLAKTARRGTFQSIPESGIGALMGSLWGLVLEMVDSTVSVKVSVDGVEVVPKREIFLRMCTPPMPCRFGFTIPENAKRVDAELTIGGFTRTEVLELPRAGENVQPECAIEAVNMITAKCYEDAVVLIGRSDFQAAVDRNKEAIAAIKVFENIDDSDLKQAIAAAIKDLDTPQLSKDTPECARDAQVRAMSRESSARANGVSIDPGATRTQSHRQRVLSEI
jgi:Mg-chelatase subunit ChlD